MYPSALSAAQTPTTKIAARVVESDSNACRTACTCTAIPHRMPISNVLSDANTPARPRSAPYPITDNPEDSRATATHGAEAKLQRLMRPRQPSVEGAPIIQRPATMMTTTAAAHAACPTATCHRSDPMTGPRVPGSSAEDSGPWLLDGSTNAHIVEAANPAARTARPW